MMADPPVIASNGVYLRPNEVYNIEQHVREGEGKRKEGKEWGGGKPCSWSNVFAAKNFNASVMLSLAH